MFSKIFPKTNELTVFVIAVVLYVTVLFNVDLASTLIDKVSLLWAAWRTDFSESSSIYSDIKLILGLIFIVTACLSYLIGPLLMPFTKKDIRVLSIIILWIDVSLIIFWNVKSSEPGQWYRLIPVLYGSAWLFYSIIVLRLDTKNGIDLLVTTEQTNPQIALKFAVVGAALSIVLFYLFNLKWLDAYMLAIFLTFILEKTLSELEAHSKQSQQNSPGG